VGVHVVQLAKLAGAFVTGQTTSPEKVDAIRDAGADEVVQARFDFSAVVRDLSSGGVDVVIDNVGTAISGDAALSRAGRTVDDGRPAHW
jgi:acryloyl-coenzyme A reductase